jgi:hypothetical protein
MPLSKIKTNSVAAANITPALISSLTGLTVSNTAITGTLTTSQIADSAITRDKITNQAVNSSKVDAGAIFVNAIASWPNGNNENLNNLLASGSYTYVVGSYTGSQNAPPVYGYGTLLVYYAGSFITQIVYPHEGTNASYWRTKYNAVNNDTYWTAWRAM